MKLSLRILFFLIFIYILIPGYIFAEVKSSDTIDLDFEIPEAEKNRITSMLNLRYQKRLRGLMRTASFFIRDTRTAVMMVTFIKPI